MKDKAEKLPGRQEAALAALLSSPTVRDAAKACRLSETTLYRYLREPTFAERVREARRGLMDNLQTRLQAKAETAAKILSDIAEDEAKPASVRVAAARIIIEAAQKAHEQAELAVRLKAIEDALEAQKRGSRSELQEQAGAAGARERRRASARGRADRGGRGRRLPDRG